MSAPPKRRSPSWTSRGLSVAAYAQRHGVTVRTVQKWCADGRLRHRGAPAAILVCTLYGARSVWRIHPDVEPPPDGRRRSRS